MSLSVALTALKEKRLPPEAITILALIQEAGTIHDVRTLHLMTGWTAAVVKESVAALGREGIMSIPSGYMKQSANAPEEQAEVDQAIRIFDREEYTRTGHTLERQWGRDRKMMKAILANFGENFERITIDWMNWRAREKRPIAIPLLYANREIVHQKWKQAKMLIRRQRPEGAVPARAVTAVPVPVDPEAVRRVEALLEQRRKGIPSSYAERPITDL